MFFRRDFNSADAAAIAAQQAYRSTRQQGASEGVALAHAGKAAKGAGGLINAQKQGYGRMVEDTRKPNKYTGGV